MADKDTDVPENDNPDDDDADDDAARAAADEDGDDDDDSGSDDDEKGSKKDPELAKAIRTRDRVKAENRRLKAELEASKKKDDDDEPDPVAQANTKIVRTAAHGILRGLGVEDKEDRVEILNMLRLDDVTVDEDGADEDEIEERIEILRRVFGGKKQAPGRTVPKTVKTNRNSKEENTDADKSRYRKFLGASR